MGQKYKSVLSQFFGYQEAKASLMQLRDVANSDIVDIVWSKVAELVWEQSWDQVKTQVHAQMVEQSKSVNLSAHFGLAVTDFDQVLRNGVLSVDVYDWTVNNVSEIVWSQAWDQVRTQIWEQVCIELQEDFVDG